MPGAPTIDEAGYAAVIAAAAAGDAHAQALHGQMLLDGVGVTRDPRAAVAWFRRAAAQRHWMALNMVGRCYDQGWGVAVDKARAAQCFATAAEAGLPEAMYNFATLLTLGEGLAEDKVAALGWLERAAAQGYAKAINFVGSFAEDGWAGPRDMAKAARCYAAAAEGGDFRGAFNHARMLGEAGRIDAALGWLARAAEWGNAPFRAKAAAWLAASGEKRFANEGAALMRERDGC